MMDQGPICDTLNFILDVFQALMNIAYTIPSALGVPIPIIRDLLPFASVVGCNIS